MMEAGLENVTGGAATESQTPDEREKLKREIIEEVKRELAQARKPWRIQLRGRNTR